MTNKTIKAIGFDNKVKEMTPEEIIDSLGFGTSLQEEILVKYKDLVKVFGEPETEDIDNYKTDAEWTIFTPYGVATIYNYKDGKNYLGKDGLAKEEITNWHIGGHSKEVVEPIVRALGLKKK